MKIILAIIAAAILVMGCQPQPKSAEQKNRAAQLTLMERATARTPVPEVSNFLTRQNLAEWMRRMDDPSKTWYIYELGDMGNVIGYYVGRTYPQSICTFMTPPEEIKRVRDVGVTVTSPALDGVYYKGGGCDTYFFFDAETDALIHLTGMRLRVSDVPLDLDVEPIQVEAAFRP